MTDIDRSQALPKLALLLNSHHDHKKVIQIALEHLKRFITAEAATLFLTDETGDGVLFWATQGGAGAKLAGSKMPLRGIVGWVIEQVQSTLVPDVEKDPRFFRDIDKETSFKTKNLICAPLIVRGNTAIGALQVINSGEPQGFTNDDLTFLELFAHITALAVDNARLVSSLKSRTHTLEELNKKRDDFLNIIAHEFRTPLNIIQMSAELLGHRLIKSPEEGERIYQTLSRAIEQLSLRIGEIRSLTSVSADTLSLRLEDTDLSKLIHEVFEMHEPAAKKRNLTFTLDPSPTPLMVRCDPSLVLLALCNLVRNAIRFTPDKGDIVLAANRSAGFLRIVIKDTGIGISDEQQEAIFEKFFEAVPILKHSSGDMSFASAGMGLGLSTALAIARAHKGDIEVESKIGSGSTFTFLIPT